MLEAMRHRGPDYQGQYSRNQAVLGQRRLSIVDSDGGHQPILNEDESAATIVNGEIYNAAGLRVWREKTQFDEGSGTADLVAGLTPAMADRFGVSSTGTSSARELEERVYRALFRRYFSESAESLVARWRGGSVEERADDHTRGRFQDV